MRNQQPFLRRMRALALLLFFAAPHARACSCVLGDLKPAFNAAAAVFVGEVIDYEGGVARLRAVEVFKGPRAETIEVATSESSAACGYGGSLVPGSRHLIFADAENGSTRLRVSLCSRTNREENAACELAFLRSHRSWLRRVLARWPHC
ncbi:MAG TPA: hypothetical protein VF824_13765 [Thermoanaerobaculia bacterium]|jgi:hypothetical protein